MKHLPHARLRDSRRSRALCGWTNDVRSVRAYGRGRGNRVQGIIEPKASVRSPVGERGCLETTDPPNCSEKGTNVQSSQGRLTRSVGQDREKGHMAAWRELGWGTGAKSM